MKAGFELYATLPHRSCLLRRFQIIVNHNFDGKTPRFDVQLFFDEIGVALDDSQYRDVISLLDMYHVYIRKHQVRNTPSFVSRL